MRGYTARKTESSCVDRETREVIKHTERIEFVPVDVEPFFFTYSKEIMALYGKPLFNATTKVLWKLLEYAEYNTGKVYMNAVRKQELMEECKISKASYDRAIKELVEVGIITKERTLYTINESMFWRGDRKTREALKKARLRVTLSPIFLEPETFDENPEAVQEKEGKEGEEGEA